MLRDHKELVEKVVSYRTSSENILFPDGPIGLPVFASKHTFPQLDTVQYCTVARLTTAWHVGFDRFRLSTW
jgi:hypothetical protein